MITVVDYKAGNLTSVRLAFEALDVAVEVTDDPARVLAAERVVFPGVGAAGASMSNLRELGLADAIRTVAGGGTPFLGICMGMQVLFERSEEDGGVGCLGLMPGAVKRFRPSDPMCKVPQMGWNAVHFAREHPLFAGIEDGTEFYFVHSYYPTPCETGHVIARTEYAGVRFASVAGAGNVAATQFHPEKSGRIGLTILENFCRWNGKC